MPHPLAPERSYAHFMQWLATEHDPRIAVRVLRQYRMHADTLTEMADIDAFHQRPALRGDGWDALIAGVAEMTGAAKVSDVRVLDWTEEPQRYRPAATLFDPLDSDRRYQWLDYLRTPIHLRVRNVVLAAGNLQGV